MIKNKIDNSKVKEIIQINGLTNKNYKVSTENNEYILRIQADDVNSPDAMFTKRQYHGIIYEYDLLEPFALRWYNI